MADKIFRPHRGTKTFMEDAGTVLADGELFFEVPDLGVGQGTCNIKMGDGSTAYKDLPYAINVPETTMNFTTSSTSSNSDLLDEISAGKSLSDLIGSIKKLLSNLNGNVDTINSNISTMNTTLSGKADTNHASSSTTYGGGTASNYGHVKLSDTYTSSSGAAADSVAASNKALYDAYTTLNTSVSSLQSSITSINNDLSNINTDISNLDRYKIENVSIVSPESLAEFVQATNVGQRMGSFFRVNDTNAILVSTSESEDKWVEGIVFYQNTYSSSSTFSVVGNAIIGQQSGSNLYYVKISGNGGTSFSKTQYTISKS